MTKQAFLAVAGFFGCCLLSSAQETQRSVLFTLSSPIHSGSAARSGFNPFGGAYYGFPSLTLLNGHRFSLSNAYDWIEPMSPDFLPATIAHEPARVGTAVTSGRDSSDKSVEARPKLFDYVGGEVGVLYGRSTGKFSREVESGYIFGEMGNDKTQISVGAFYEHESGHVPRPGR